MARPAPILLLIAALCALSLLWMLQLGPADGEIAAPPAEQSPEPVAPSRLPAQPRIALARTEPKPEDSAAQERPTTPEPEPAPSKSTAGGLLVLEVVDQRNGIRLESFNLVLVEPSGEARDRRVEAGRLELPLELGEVVTLNIEAPGFEPQRIEGLSLSPAEPQRSLRIEMQPAVIASGVSLDVLDPHMLPVPSVRLRVLFRETSRPQDEPLAILWQREAKSETGHYDLPDLAPGHYSFEVEALDAAGSLAAMQPGSHELSYYGAERVPITMQLEAGGLLSLVVRGQTGRVLGTEVTLRLEDANGKPIETRWLAENEEDTLEAFDMLPAAQRCRLGQVLPPGDYMLRLRGKGRALNRGLHLEPWQDLKMELVL